MSVKLVWVTPDAEQLIGKMARVSNPANEDNPNVVGLLKYLIKHKHWSPFEMASMCVHIETTRAISPQILRHSSFGFQEYSQRYAVSTEFELPHLRRQDVVNRQSSIDDIPQSVNENFGSDIADHMCEGVKLYQRMLDAGVAKECARAVLPLNTTTRLYMSGTIRSWLHYIDLRSANGTQKEHMDIALGAKNILAEQLPNVCKAMWGDPTIQLQQAP